MLTQMLLATVSLCVLYETAVRSRPCAQLLPQPATRMRRLMRSELLARAQLSAKTAEAWNQKSILSAPFVFLRCSTPTKSTIPRRMVYLYRAC